MLLSWLTVLVYFALCCLELRMGKARSVCIREWEKVPELGGKSRPWLSTHAKTTTIGRCNPKLPLSVCW